MRNATSIGMFGASALALTLLGACGGSGSGTRDDGASGSSTNTSGSGTTLAGTTSTGTSGSGTVGTGGSSTTGSGGSTTGTAGTTTSSSGSGGGASTCTMAAGSKHGDGTTTVIDDLDDTNTMFTPPGMGAGSWDLSKDTAATAMGTMVPANTAALLPVTGGHMGSALHVVGTGLTGWGAALAAFLNGPTGAYDASSYGGVAFWIKGTTSVQEGTNKLMVQARMPDVLPGPGSCCDDKVPGKECYSGHRVVIDVPADWQEVKIAWTDFTGPTFGLGSTIAFDPSRIRDIDFSFNHDAMSTTATTSFDFWVDGVRFLTKAEMGNVGSGSGGAAAGGSAGASSGGGGTGGTGGTQ